MGNVLNVSFHPSEIGEQLTQVACVRQARCARERLAEQNRARDREYKRALRDRLRVCGKCVLLVCETRETCCV